MPNVTRRETTSHSESTESTPRVSDTDQESEYETGLEDFTDGDPAEKTKKRNPKTKQPSICLNDLSRISAFIQNVLREDQLAGIAIVDLFISVKSANDNLDYLAKTNSEISEKMALFNDNSRVFKKEYKSLVVKMRTLLDRIKDDSLVQEKLKIQQVINPPAESNDDDVSKSTEACVTKESQVPEKSEPDREEQTQTPENKAFCSKRNDCDFSGKEESQKFEEKNESTASASLCSRQEDTDNTQTKRNCFCCLISKIGQTPDNRHSTFPEAFLGSFLASLLYLQKAQERSSTSSLEEKLKFYEGGTFQDSVGQVLCNLCQILSGTTGQKLRMKDPSQVSLTKPYERKEDLESCSGGSCESVLSSSKPIVTSEKSPFKNEVSCLYRGKVSQAKWSVSKKKAATGKRGESFGATEEVRNETSDGEFEFEEATSCSFIPSTSYDLRPKPSVTCMGDLTRAVTGKRSASTLTSPNNVTPSWIRKLSNEIRSKFKSSRTNLRVYEKTYAKCGKELERVADALKFTISADTPVGMLDVTVVQHKKRRTLKGRFLKLNKARSQGAAAPNGHFSGRPLNFLEDNSEWSEDSLRIYDSESVDSESNSVEDMEEFLEVFVKGSKKDVQAKKTSFIVEKGFSKKMELLAGKPHFFQIQKCYPVYFVQEFVRKRPEVKENEREEKIEEIIAVPSRGKQEKQLIIEGSSSDLIIYIQVEVEEEKEQNAEDVAITLKSQTMEVKPESEERIVRLEEGRQDGESLYKIWEDPKKSKEKVLGGTNLAEDLTVEKNSVLFGNELKKKPVLSKEILSEMYIEKEIHETVLEEPGTVDSLRVVDLRTLKQQADIWLQQNNTFKVERLEVLTPIIIPAVSKEVIESINTNNVELQKALTLIREIESNIVNVKLGDAISILPRLESELRKHLEVKMKTLREKEAGEYYFSSSEFRPAEKFVSSSSSSGESKNSENRLKNLLKMLSDLEEAVKMNECSSNESCDYNSSKIYQLLHSLVVSIREVEVDLSYRSLSQSFEIASELDTAVREYEEMSKKLSLDSYSPMEKGKKNKKTKNDSKSLDVVLGKERLQNVRKKVFEKAEESAFVIEKQIEKDFDRLDRLEVENDEALNFLETFLKKSERRVSELENLKSKLQKLSEALKVMFENFEELKKQQHIRAEKLASLEKAKKMSNSTLEVEPVKETVSGLLEALDNLKSVAKEKNEIRKEIFLESDAESEISPQRSSRSSFTTKNSHQVNGELIEFKRVGETSLYLSWSKPKNVLQDSLVGYQIYVNEKLHQKVRNPHRLQAVLYAVDFTKKNEIQLYAVGENNQKILLATVDCI